MKNILFFILILVSLTVSVTIYKNDNFDAFAEIEIPTEFETFKDDEYGIEFEYPANWVQFGDVEFGDYTTNIAIFAPLEEVKFKKFDSWKDYYKFDYRFMIDLDYSYVIPKVNLQRSLDSVMNDILDVPSGFKKSKILETTTKSKLSDRHAYEVTYQGKYKGDKLKYSEIGTIVEDNMVLAINFKSKAKDYDKLLPIFEHIKNSFKITNPDW